MKKSIQAIILSYKRPQNIQRIVDEILKSKFDIDVLISNNNPVIDLTKYLKPHSLVTITQSSKHLKPSHRITLAKESDYEHFLFIDDDMFPTATQIDQLLSEMFLNESIPHGAFTAQNFTNNLYLSRINPKNESVDILNSIYAITKAHIDRCFELLTLLKINCIENLGFVDDILLSFSGESKPQCHDLGICDQCFSSEGEVAVHMRIENFHEIRDRFYRRISKIGFAKD